MKHNKSILIFALPFILQACNAVDCIDGEQTTYRNGLNNELLQCTNGSFVKTECIDDTAYSVDGKQWYCKAGYLRGACSDTCTVSSGQKCIDFCTSQGTDFCYQDGSLVHCVKLNGNNGQTPTPEDSCTKGAKGCDGNTSWSCESGKVVKKSCGTLTCSNGECVDNKKPEQGENCTEGAKGCDGNTSWVCENKEIIEKNCGALSCIAGECACQNGSHIYQNACEANDTEHCGSHENNCATTVDAWKSGNCYIDQCVATACEDGYHVYEGTCEADTINACGDHNRNCATAIKGWKTGICEDGYCQAQTCIDGMHLSAGTCLEDDAEHCGPTQIDCSTTIAGWLSGSCNEGKCQVETFTFGKYEQDNDTNNGKEPIVWRFLTQNASGHSLVISEKELDVKKFNEWRSSITWEYSTIRSWLNGYPASYNKLEKDYSSDNFIDAAFSSEEKAKIITSLVPADANPDTSADPGNATNDKIFLLSVNEVKNYLTRDNLPASATKYVAQKYIQRDNWAFDWWLRTPGRSNQEPAYVTNNGAITNMGKSVDDSPVAVRPAFWIKL